MVKSPERGGLSVLGTAAFNKAEAMPEINNVFKTIACSFVGAGWLGGLARIVKKIDTNNGCPLLFFRGELGFGVVTPAEACHRLGLIGVTD